MISRVAESCFWMCRHLERVESTARLLQVNRSFILDISLPEIERWFPLVIVVGERKRFSKLFDEDARQDEELIQGYLTWDEENTVSIKNSVYWARENARTIREVISLDMWEEINSLWHWISQGPGKRLYRSDRDRFFRHLISSVNTIYGVLNNTQSHEAPYDFMQTGLFLERAGQTARILDFKYHSIGPTKLNMESPIEIAEWMALLRSCSAQDAFLKKVKSGITGPSIFEFLVKDSQFPRSVLYCLERSDKFLRRVRPEGTSNSQSSSIKVLNKLINHLKNTTTQEALEKSIHKELTYIVDSTTDICSQLNKDYFDIEVPKEIVEEPKAKTSTIHL